MPDNSSNSKRIAKNTVMLYIRMLLSMVVSLYTSRVVLQTLGVENYGIYGVVGGVVGMFSFLNAAMAGATSRFLTYEMGKAVAGQESKLPQTFSSALIIHICIAIVVLVLSETIGLWFLNHKLVIPEARMGAAHWVFQFSILSMAVSVTQVPYNACIIAHEKMDIYAYIELLHVFLKLGIVYLLVIGNFDKLILYAGLVLAVGVLIAMIYRVYCIRHYKESHFYWVWDKHLLLPMIKFSGWNVYGNMCVTVRQQGNNFLINMFFGVALNAASTITTNVYGIIIGFGSNIISASRPQIVKAYAQNDINYMQSLMHNVSKFAVILMGFMIVPFILEMPYLLDLWLDEVPQFASTFCRILMITAPLVMLSNTLMIGVHATGNIKQYSLITGTCYMLSIPVAYLVLCLGGSEISTYIVSICTTTVVLFSNMFVLKRQINSFSPKHYLKNIVATFLVIIISGFISLLVKRTMSMGFLRLLCVAGTNFILLTICSYLFLLDALTKRKVLSTILHKQYD